MALSLTTVSTFTVKSGTNTIGYIPDAVTAEAHDEAQGIYMEVATGTTDGAVNLGPLTTIEALAITSTQTVSFKFNAGTTSIQCKALTIRGAAITAISVTNASGSTAILEGQLVGT